MMTRIQLQRLCSFASLISLELADADDAMLEDICSLPLQTLDISYCNEVTEAGLAHFSSMSLRKFNMEGCAGLADTGLAHLSSLPLEELNMNFDEDCDSSLNIDV